jgi:diadenosine tetraphosphatase ApaH/serine/threonine PP2A family protein phosphatase
MNEYLFEDKPDATFARIAAGADADADVIVGGHTHRPYDKTVGPARFVNVGSAGKPKDGDPRACWALLEASADNLRVEFRRVPYEIDPAARAIEASDLPNEFAMPLREARGYRAAVRA